MNYLDNKEMCKAVVDFKCKRNRKTEDKLIKIFNKLILNILRKYKGVNHLHDDMIAQSYFNLFRNLHNFKFKPDFYKENEVKIKRMKYIKKYIKELNYNNDDLKFISNLALTQEKATIINIDNETSTIDIRYDDYDICIPFKFVNINNAFSWFTSCVLDSFKQIVMLERNEYRNIQSVMVDSEIYKSSLDFSTEYEKDKVRERIDISREWFLKKRLKNKWGIVTRNPSKPNTKGVFDI